MTRPYQFQIQGVRRMHQLRGRVLLADSMGLGKSLSALLYAARRPDLKPIIVVCPASLKYTWERESAIHFNWRAEVLESMTPDVSSGPFTQHNLLVINYDILHPGKHGPGWLHFLKGLNPQLVILD